MREDTCKVDALNERMKLLEVLKSADVIVIGTSTCNMDVPSKLKALLERDFLENYLKTFTSVQSWLKSFFAVYNFLEVMPNLS
ncbi:hypothetical protein ADU37_CDS10560 [Thermococcus sp. 2319x1]|nr:hypothetical protein ADU37_CDS10560 [Thermococcus sp. 2319x1]